MNKGFKKIAKNTLFASSVALAMFSFVNLSIAQENPKQDSEDSVKTEQRDLAKERRDERDIKTINDRINKTRDEYVILVRTRFLNNTDRLSSILAKIETRITKLEIAGEEVSELKEKSEKAKSLISKSRTNLRALPSRQTNIDYSSSRKYATTIIESRNDLEEAKEILTSIVSDLKDFIIEKDSKEDERK